MKKVLDDCHSRHDDDKCVRYKLIVTLEWKYKDGNAQGTHGFSAYLVEGNWVVYDFKNRDGGTVKVIEDYAKETEQVWISEWV